MLYFNCLRLDSTLPRGRLLLVLTYLLHTYFVGLHLPSAFASSPGDWNESGRTCSCYSDRLIFLTITLIRTEIS